jgi:signal transduction histidine kinase
MSSVQTAAEMSKNLTHESRLAPKWCDSPIEESGSMGMFWVGERHTAHRKKTKPTGNPGVNLRDDAALGALAMSIVHDLRNPLATIHSGAEMLSGSQLPDQQVRRLARNMYNASVRIQELFQDYVDLCRTRESQPRPCNLRTLVAHAVDRIAAVAEAQTVVVVQNVPPDLTVTLDRPRIGSVLANLLTNALEAMPTAGSIHISAITGERSVVIRVRDTGPGVAPEIRDRLFQPFVTARKRNGWGLGLVHARQVVIDHGGEMWLESPPDSGACFAFSLPAS